MSSTLAAHHGLPPEPGDRLATFDRELEHRIERALIDGTAGGAFRSGPDVATTTRLVRHMLNAVSELVAESPGSTPHVVRDTTATILAALRHDRPIGPGSPCQTAPPATSMSKAVM